MSATIAQSVIGALAVFAALLALSGWLAARPLHAAWLGLGMIVVEASHLPLAVRFGIWLYPEDVVFALLALACLIRLTLYASPRAVPLAWWAIGAIQLFLLVWGFGTAGSSAGVDYRMHFYLWVAVCYFSSVQWSESAITGVLNAWVVCAGMLCLLAAYRWINSAIDPVYAEEIMGLDTTGVRFRVVSASSSLTIAVGFLILLKRTLDRRLPLLQRSLLPVFLVAVVVLQHRSVWVSLLVGALCLAWARRRGQGRWQGSRPALRVIAILMLPVALLFAIPDDGGGVAASIKGAAGSAVSTKEGTMVARVDNWQQLLATWSNSNALTYLIGKPYGTGYNPHISKDSGEVVDMVPHNHFMHILYRGGLACLLATLLLFYRMWRCAVAHARRGDKYWAPCLVGVCGAFFAYFIPYWATYGCGILIGIAISYLGVAQGRAARVAGAPLAHGMRVPS